MIVVYSAFTGDMLKVYTVNGNIYIQGKIVNSNTPPSNNKRRNQVDRMGDWVWGPPVADPPAKHLHSQFCKKREQK